MRMLLGIILVILIIVLVVLLLGVSYLLWDDVRDTWEDNKRKKEILKKKNKGASDDE